MAYTNRKFNWDLDKLKRFRDKYVTDSIIKNGPAFDLSAYNNGATYADLSAALTALNALPADYKKGGMSFKFVLTSDNKYVQFRYMLEYANTTAGNAAFVNAANWQGVDDEPTAGSNNLVKSGGVAMDVNNIYRAQSVKNITVTAGQELRASIGVGIPSGKFAFIFEGKSLFDDDIAVYKNSVTVANKILEIHVDNKYEVSTDGPVDSLIFYRNAAHVIGSGTITVTIEENGVLLEKMDNVEKQIKFYDLSPAKETYEDKNAARMSVPQAKRGFGIVLSYLLEDGTKVLEQALDSAGGWPYNSAWYDLKASCNLILLFDTDVATTRISIPYQLKKRGVIITYFNGEKMVTERYKSSDVSTTEIVKDSNWEEFALTKDVYNVVLPIDVMFPLGSGQYHTINTAIANLPSNTPRGTQIYFRDSLLSAKRYIFNIYSGSYNNPLSWTPMDNTDEESVLLFDYRQTCSTSELSRKFFPAISKGFYKIKVSEVTANVNKVMFVFTADGSTKIVNIFDFGKWIDVFIPASQEPFVQILSTDVATGGEINVQFMKVGELQKNAEFKKFSLLNRHKELNIIKDDYFGVRPQFALTSFKSFKPVLDYKGTLCFEGMVDYAAKDQTKPLLFEEHILTINQDIDHNLTAYISADGKSFEKYTDAGDFKPSAIGCDSMSAIGSSVNGLILSKYHKTDTTYNHLYYLAWSLDGGRSFEPALHTLRASVAISASDISAGDSITIDGNTFQAVAVATIQTYLQSLGGTSQERIAAARTYLADKVLVTANTQDKLRCLAYLLIEKGFKVRIDSETLYVYWKVAGTTGNGQTMVVGGSSKTFSGGIDWSASDILAATNLSKGTTGLTYSNGTEILSTDVWDICSFLYIDNKWHLFGYYLSNGVTTGSQAANLDLIINDIADIQNTSYSYSKVCDSPAINSGSQLEPIASYSSYLNLILVGFRPQDYDNTLKYVYSKDNGATWSALQSLPDNIGCFQSNVGVFVARNPKFATGGFEKFYNHVNGSNKNIFVALCSDRHYTVFYACTADVSNGIENALWSDWEVIDRTNDNGYCETLQDYNIEQGIYSEGTSIGSMCYAPLHCGLCMLYAGRRVMNIDDYPLVSWVPMLTIEEC